MLNMFYRCKQVKGGNGTGRPIVNMGTIVFNGTDSYETFSLNRIGNDYEFCKTAEKPYDRYVKAVLVIANFYAPNALTVSSDGNDPNDWNEGVRLATLYVEQDTGRSPFNPIPYDLSKQITIS